MSPAALDELLASLLEVACVCAHGAAGHEPVALEAGWWTLGACAWCRCPGGNLGLPPHRSSLERRTEALRGAA